MKSFRQPRLLRKTAYHFKIFDAVPMLLSIEMNSHILKEMIDRTPVKVDGYFEINAPPCGTFIIHMPS